MAKTIKIFLISSGKVFHALKQQADLHLNAQQIKADIGSKKANTL